MTTAIAIDFGTSNSAVGFWSQGAPRLVALEDQRTTIPSALFYDTEENRVLFGQEAISAYVDGGGGRLLRSLKSILGSSLIEDATEIGRRNVRFKTIIGHFIGHLKQQAEKAIGGPVDSVVMGRPVRFVDSDDAADAMAQAHLEEIARQCGFKQVLFQYEPIAAALDYEHSVTREELALIADIGGGTSDFSIIRVSPERRGKQERQDDILANAGVHVGGTDLDRRLSLEQVMPLFGYRTQTRALLEGAAILNVSASFYRELATWHRIVFLYTPAVLRAVREMRYRAARPDLVERLVRIIHHQEGHRLAGDVEAAKIALSEKGSVPLPLGYVEAGLEATVSGKTFEEDTREARERMVLKIEECLRLAGVDAGEITTLFLTGGTTAIPTIARACRESVPGARVVEGERFSSVGIGLTIDAGLRFR